MVESRSEMRVFHGSSIIMKPVLLNSLNIGETDNLNCLLQILTEIEAGRCPAQWERVPTVIQK